MKVLFVSSGNNISGISTIVANQGASIRNEGIYLNYFTIKGRGAIGYLKNIPVLKRHLNNNRYDIIHAHFSLSALVATLTFSGIPLVISLMGSDVQMNRLWLGIIKINYRFFWYAVIVKSETMKEKLKLKNAFVIPNGVDLNKFILVDKNIARQKLDIAPTEKYILFLADPTRYEKNFALAQKAICLLKKESLILKVIFNENQDTIVNYLNAVDLLLLTSFWEGSPNVLKEAMACNCPIVATDVGDVRWLLDGVEGHFISSFSPIDVAAKIEQAIDFSNKIVRTRGRERIIKLGLDSNNVAQKIISVYKNVLKK